MAEVRHVKARDGDVVLLVGTMKGSFVMRSSGARTKWEVGGPYFPGHANYALAYDGRNGTPTIYAGGFSYHWGPYISASADFGATWSKHDERPIRMPEGTESKLEKIWQIQPAGKNQPGVIYAGVEPAALFESRDHGVTWTLNQGLWNHPHRPQWQPGGGGLCLHTILPDATRAERMWIAISTGGVYRTDDGGASWQVSNSGVRAQFLPDQHPEFGQCVHKVVSHPTRPERLFLQNHWGLYRSENGARSWQDIANGVPSDFGFAMAMHPHDPDTVYIVPLESDEFRVTPQGRMRVYRTRDGGGSWEALTRGLPQKDAMETVLRDAMDVDEMNPAGVYFGTRSGRLYGSPNGGSSWNLIHGGLPPIVCVKAAIVGEPSRVRATGARKAAKPVARKKTARSSAGRRKTKSGPRAARRAKPARAKAGGARSATRTRGVRARKAKARPGRRS